MKYTHFLLVPIVAVTFVALPADAASVDYFIKIDGVDGESKTQSSSESTTHRGVAGTTFTLDASRSTDDGTMNSFSWRQVSGPYRFDTQSGSTLSITPQTSGTYVFELTATDPRGTVVATERVEIVVAQESAGIEPDEIDYDGSQKTNFGVLLDSGDAASADAAAEARARTGDLDGDGYGDAIREGGKTIDAGSVPEAQARMRAQEAADANAGIEPDEIDARVAAEEDAFLTIRVVGEGANGGARDVPLRGLLVDFRDEDSDDDGVMDAESADHEAEITLKSPRVAVKVNAVEVRGWDPETKEAVRARVAQNDAKNDANDVGMFVALQALDNDAVTDISVDDTEVVVTYETELAIFGFVPVRTVAEARVMRNGEVKVRYPWWSFLARRAQTDAAYTTIASDIHARIAIEEEGVPAVDESKATR